MINVYEAESAERLLGATEVEKTTKTMDASSQVHTARGNVMLPYLIHLREFTISRHFHAEQCDPLSSHCAINGCSLLRMT